MIKHETIGSNQYKVVDNGNIFYFSYETIVAFRRRDDIRISVCENVWSRTTGKLLNKLEPDKALRLDEVMFNGLLATL